MLLLVQAVLDLVAVKGIGTDIATTLLVTAGDNPDRLRSESAFAHLSGAAAILASSGKTNRHRLNRGGEALPCPPALSDTGPKPSSTSALSVSSAGPAPLALAPGARHLYDHLRAQL